MGDIVNLRLVRKAKARARAVELAARNRALHGRTKQDKLATKTQAERQRRLLEGAKLED